jgi:hypothetical protein
MKTIPGKLDWRFLTAGGLEQPPVMIVLMSEVPVEGHMLTREERAKLAEFNVPYREWYVRRVNSNTLEGELCCFADKGHRLERAGLLVCF